MKFSDQLKVRVDGNSDGALVRVWVEDTSLLGIKSIDLNHENLHSQVLWCAKAKDILLRKLF